MLPSVKAHVERKPDETKKIFERLRVELSLGGVAPFIFLHRLETQVKFAVSVIAAFMVIVWLALIPV
jgi:hypothetical protein